MNRRVPKAEYDPGQVVIPEDWKRPDPRVTMRWFAHPFIEGGGKGVDPACGHPWEDHGWIDLGTHDYLDEGGSTLRGLTVCPSNQGPFRGAQQARDADSKTEGHKVEATTYGRRGDIEITHKDGLPWWKAPRPFWLHRCKPQTTGWISLDQVERCACGAYRVNQRRWWDKNSRLHKSGTLR